MPADAMKRHVWRELLVFVESTIFSDQVEHSPVHDVAVVTTRRDLPCLPVLPSRARHTTGKTRWQPGPPPHSSRAVGLASRRRSANASPSRAPVGKWPATNVVQRRPESCTHLARTWPRRAQQRSRRNEPRTPPGGETHLIAVWPSFMDGTTALVFRAGGAHEPESDARSPGELGSSSGSSEYMYSVLTNACRQMCRVHVCR